MRASTMAVAVFALLGFSSSAIALTCGNSGPKYYADKHKVCYKQGNQCKCMDANFGANSIAPGMPGYNRRELEQRIERVLVAKAAAAGAANKPAMNAQLQGFQASMQKF